jgi:hypothetical protein
MNCQSPSVTASAAVAADDFSSWGSLRPPRPLREAISCDTARPGFPVTLPKLARLKQPLTSHYVEDPNPLTVKPVEDPAGRLDNLPVSRTTELGRHGSAFWMPFQLFDMFKDSLDETARSLAVVQSNVIRDRVQIS